MRAVGQRAVGHDRDATAAIAEYFATDGPALEFLKADIVKDSEFGLEVAVDWLRFAVGDWHAHAHNLACRERYAQRVTVGTGRILGEIVGSLNRKLRLYTIPFRQLGHYALRISMQAALFLHNEAATQRALQTLAAKIRQDRRELVEVRRQLRTLREEAASADVDYACAARLDLDISVWDAERRHCAKTPAAATALGVPLTPAHWHQVALLRLQITARQRELAGDENDLWRPATLTRRPKGTALETHRGTHAPTLALP
jgi:hypothetical protein